jgi:hypothetical protein
VEITGRHYSLYMSRFFFFGSAGVELRIFQLLDKHSASSTT